jgi:succinate dehydrogenase / fumarate reductase flavoprotein subunit
MYEQFKNLAGIDISQEKMEVGPTAHYSVGGVVVNTNCSTKRIAGLFAVGEVISQIHGANRLGGNSLLDTVVFGKIVGRKAAKFAKKEGNEFSKESSLALLADVNNPTEFKAFIVNEPLKFRSEIQVMTENAGIIREVTKLQTGLKKILKLKDEFYSKESII